MSTEITTTNATETFRGRAADCLHGAADATLHELVDEFQRLSNVIGTSMLPDDERVEGFFGRLSDAGKVAFRERQVVLAASKSRFGISFETFDHPFDDNSGGWF